MRSLAAGLRPSVYALPAGRFNLEQREDRMDSVYYIKKVETQKQTNGWVSKLVIEDKVGKQLVFIGKICKGSAEAKQSCAQLYSDFRNMIYSV